MYKYKNIDWVFFLGLIILCSTVSCKKDAQIFLLRTSVPSGISVQ